MEAKFGDEFLKNPLQDKVQSVQSTCSTRISVLAFSQSLVMYYKLSIGQLLLHERDLGALTCFLDVRVIQILYLESKPLADILNAQLCVNFDLLY